jgi:hypothetical protein
VPAVPSSVNEVGAAASTHRLFMIHLTPDRERTQTVESGTGAVQHAA